jgi:hypothetical protein
MLRLLRILFSRFKACIHVLQETRALFAAARAYQMISHAFRMRSAQAPVPQTYFLSLELCFPA